MDFLQLLDGAEYLAQQGDPQIAGLDYDSRRVQIRALPPDVEPATILIRAHAGVVAAHREIQVLPVAVRLIGFDAWAAYLLHQQAGNRQRIVPHQFGIQPPPALHGKLAIERVAGAQLLRRDGSLLIAIAADNEANHVFDV